MTAGRRPQRLKEREHTYYDLGLGHSLELYAVFLVEVLCPVHCTWKMEEPSPFSRGAAARGLSQQNNLME